MYLSDENMLKFEHFAFLDPGVGELPLPCVQFDVFLLSLAVIVMRIQSFTEDDDDDDDERFDEHDMVLCEFQTRFFAMHSQSQNQAPRGALERMKF